MTLAVGEREGEDKGREGGAHPDKPAWASPVAMGPGASTVQRAGRCAQRRAVRCGNRTPAAARDGSCGVAVALPSRSCVRVRVTIHAQLCLCGYYPRNCVISCILPKRGPMSLASVAVGRAVSGGVCACACVCLEAIWVWVWVCLCMVECISI